MKPELSGKIKGHIGLYLDIDPALQVGDRSAEVFPPPLPTKRPSAEERVQLVLNSFRTCLSRPIASFGIVGTVALSTTIQCVFVTATMHE